MKKCAVLCFLVLLGVQGFCQGQAQKVDAKSGSAAESSDIQHKISPEKEAKIRKLLDLSGVQETVAVMMSSMEKSMRPLLSSSLPPGDYRERLIDLFLQRFREKATIPKMVDLAVPAYDKYFTDEELSAVLAFYETPAGRKALSVTPKIVMEVQEKGQAWGRELGKESMTEVLAEHPDLKEALEEAASKSGAPAK